MILYRLTEEGPIPFPIEKYLDCGNNIEHPRGPIKPATLQLARRAPVVPLTPKRWWFARLLARWRDESLNIPGNEDCSLDDRTDAGLRQARRATNRTRKIYGRTRHHNTT